MHEIAAILAGFLTGCATLAVIVIGVLYDRAEYERRHPSHFKNGSTGAKRLKTTNSFLQDSAPDDTTIRHQG